jgi:hypothetical protein
LKNLHNLDSVGSAMARTIARCWGANFKVNPNAGFAAYPQTTCAAESYRALMPFGHIEKPVAARLLEMIR